MVEYVTIDGEIVLASEDRIIRELLSENEMMCARIWQAPQATLEAAIAAGFKGARETNRLIYSDNY